MLLYRLPFLLFILLLITPAHAQDNLPAVIDAADVFSDVVEVVETLPLYIADEEQVSFYDYETEEWETYPYPDLPLEEGEVADAGFVEYPENSYWLGVSYYTPCTEDCGEVDEGFYLDYTPPQAVSVRERWHFDLNTGEFTPFAAICGGYAQALPNQGEWVVYSSNSQLYLCNTETGQTSAPLPELARTTPLLNAASLSANGRWLVFTFYYDLEVFVYDFVENTLISLGTMTSTSPFFSLDYPIIDWIDDQSIVLTNPTSNEGGDRHFYLYRAQISQAGSLELIYHSRRRSALRLESPIRYLWVGRQFDDTPRGGTPPPPEEDCVIHEYNPVDSTISSYTIAGRCTYPSLPTPTAPVSPSNVRASPDNRFLLVEGDVGTLNIQNLETLEIITIARTPNSESITAAWRDNGLLIVTVWQGDFYRGRLGRWLVRVNL